MQIAEESMARDKGVPVVKVHFDQLNRSPSTAEETDERKQEGGDTIMKKLMEAMKTKPRAEERTVVYYPEAVEVW